LGVLPDSPITPFTPLLAIERWRTAEAWRQWQAGERSVALAAWDRSINDWVNSADDSLIDAMISMTVLSQIQLALQDAVARTDRIDDAAARAARAALARLGVLPEAISQSLLAEWHTQASLMRSLRSLPAESLSVATDLSGPMAHVSSLWHALTFDVNDTLNALASEHAVMNAAMVAAARGEAAPRIHSNAAANANGFGCAPLHTAAALCLPFMRNPVGRLLVTIATPMYAPYGLRVADVQNLAAATRLTVEARRQGLSGEALAQFVANAPADMRDLFTKQPFVYDASKRLLRVELRHKSNVLGDAGSYELTL
jgi:hypothetical protein